ncbi:MAG: glycerol-3-phosphate 1-O-acyltransferase PlsY [Candidatus Dormibacteria bacterium]
MPRRLSNVTAVAAGYVIGSVPVGLLLGKALRRGLDVREHGSHSIGTTNVLRQLGPAAAATTFALDVAKGAAAVGVARRLGADREGQALAGFSAMVGHAWPVFAEFRGGKSVATGFGAMLPVTGWGSATAVAGGMWTLVGTRIVSLASMSAGASAVVGAAIEAKRTGNRVPLAFALLASGLIALRHSANIRRLLRGEEPRVSLSGRRGATSP